jgi:hypothetical protein
MPLDEQYEKLDDIISDMEAYNRNIDIVIRNGDKEVAEKETLIFNEYIDKFSRFVDGGNDPLLRDNAPLDNRDLLDSTAIDNTTIEEELDSVPIIQE